MVGDPRLSRLCQTSCAGNSFATLLFVFVSDSMNHVKRPTAGVTRCFYSIRCHVATALRALDSSPRPSGVCPRCKNKEDNTHRTIGHHCWPAQEDGVNNSAQDCRAPGNAPHQQSTPIPAV